MIPTLVRARSLAIVLAAPIAALVAPSVSAQNATPRAQPYVVKDVRLAEATDAPRKMLVLRNGRIERIVEANSEVPVGAREVDGKGMLVVPAFIDAFTQGGCATPTPDADKDAPPPESSSVQIDMREANRKGIQPAFRAADVFDLPKDKSKPWRESGFGALVSAPSGQLLAGTSALCTTREAAMRDTILDEDLFAYAAFRAGGGGYPSTLMGYHAQLRQFFLDVAHQRELETRYESGRPGPRPPFDAELAAGEKLVKHELRVYCEADGAQDIRRWVRLADELGLEIGIVGGREAWKVADLLKERKIPVVLTLDWGDEPKDPHEKDKKAKKDEAKPEAAKAADPKADATAPAQGEAPAPEAKPDAAKSDEKKPDDKKAADDKKKWEYEEPLGVREEKRRVWEEGRDCAKKLHEAGIEFALGSAGGTGSDLLKKVRTMVEHGLPADAAVAALTANAAKVVGADKHLGSIRAGADADFALWTANPTTKDAKIAWLFVDGFPNEFEIKDDAKAEGKPDEGVDASGTWEIEIKSDQGTRAGTLELAMTPEGDVTGKLTTTGRDNSERKVEVKGHVGGKTMTFEGTFTMRDTEVTNAWKVELSGDSLSGTSTTKGPWGESASDVSGTRKPKHEVEVESEKGASCDHP